MPAPYPGQEWKHGWVPLSPAAKREKIHLPRWGHSTVGSSHAHKAPPKPHQTTPKPGAASSKSDASAAMDAAIRAKANQRRSKPATVSARPPAQSSGKPLTGGKAFATAPGLDHASLNDQQRASLRAYTGSAYYGVNRRLRSGAKIGTGRDDAEYAQHIAHLKQAFEAVPPLQQPIQVHRGVMDADKIFGPVGGRTGKTFKDKGFVSTSTDRKVASREDFGGTQTLVNIHVPRGSRVVAMRGGHYDDEKEILLGAGARFRVTSDRLVGGRRMIDLEYLP